MCAPHFYPHIELRPSLLPPLGIEYGPITSIPLCMCPPLLSPYGVVPRNTSTLIGGGVCSSLLSPLGVEFGPALLSPCVCVCVCVCAPIGGGCAPTTIPMEFDSSSLSP